MTTGDVKTKRSQKRDDDFTAHLCTPPSGWVGTVMGGLGRAIGGRLGPVVV